MKPDEHVRPRSVTGQSNSSNDRRAKYPAGIWVEEPPPNAVFNDFLHSPAAIQEHAQHALPEIDYTYVLLGLCRLRGVVGHGMFLGNRRDHQSRMKVHQRGPQRIEFRVSPRNFNILGSVSANVIGLGR